MQVRNKEVFVIELSLEESISLSNFLSSVLQEDDCDLAFRIMNKLDKLISED